MNTSEPYFVPVSSYKKTKEREIGSVDFKDINKFDSKVCKGKKGKGKIPKPKY